MDLTKLQSSNPETVKTYVRKKFNGYNGFFFSKKERVKKCVAYYQAAGSETNRKIVEAQYFLIFKQPFPQPSDWPQEPTKPGKVESSLRLAGWQEELASAQGMVERLEMWLQGGDYQEGASFFLRLQTAMEEHDASLCDPLSYQAEYQAKCVRELTASSQRDAKSAKAAFDGMIGLKQDASFKFEGYSANWGKVSGALEESFKAGAWASGEASAKMTKLGFNASLQAAVAVGALLEVNGNFQWEKGSASLKLAGSGECFAGARASGQAKLSVSALKGIEAALAAEAFVGFRAEATGSCSFALDGKTLLGLEATAGIAIGVGASLSASVKAPIFGPTVFQFGTTLAVGIGVSTDASVSIGFSDLYLAGARQFRTLVYLPTLARGYRMDLMTDDAKNFYYLNKCIARMKEEIDELEGKISSFEKVPEDKRSLLV